MSFKNVAVVGASGPLGVLVLEALVASPSNFNITVISRSESQSKIPNSDQPSIKVLKGSYDDQSFLQSAFTGQDVVVITVGFEGVHTQVQLIDAAVAVGVKRILPSEFGGDGTIRSVVEGIPELQAKADILEHLKKAVAAKPITSWTAVFTGPFYDLCWGLPLPMWGFEVKSRQAIIYDNGAMKFDTNTIGTVATAVARILEVPNKYQNEYVYLAEHTITQQDIFNSVLKATGSKAGDWKTEHRTADSLRQQGLQKLETRDPTAILDLLWSSVYKGGNWAQYSAVQKVQNESLGLENEKESLDVVTARALRGL